MIFAAFARFGKGPTGQGGIVGFFSRFFGRRQKPEPGSNPESAIIAFAELLFQGDDGLLKDFSSALADRSGFYRKYGEELGYVDDVSDGTLGLWDFLLDFAQSRQWLCDVELERSTDGDRGLCAESRPAKSLKVDFDVLAAEHEDTETRDFLKVLAAALRSAEFELVSLDRGNDSYPLAIMKRGSVMKAEEMAKEIGLGKVDRL